jgi:predicted dehydrogenase
MLKVRWGLIGCGDIARRRVAPALRDLPVCELVAVSRANFAQAESFAREFGAKSWYRDWRDLVKDPDVDAVYIATPVHLHAAQAVAAAEAGKHVLCEKPLALSTKECERMIAASEANNVRLGVAYYRRFYPAVERAKTILRAGEIGMPVVVQMNAFERFEPEPTNPRRWLLEKGLSGGGPLFDFGCHRVEVLINLFGSVKAVKGYVANILYRREVEDTACALIRFEDGPHAVLSVTHAAREPQDTLDIFGSLGSIHVDVLNEGRLKIKTAGGERVEHHPPHQNLHQPLIEDFARAVIEGRAPLVDGRVGLKVAKVIEEIYSDAETSAETSFGGEGVGHGAGPGEFAASGD